MSDQKTDRDDESGTLKDRRVEAKLQEVKEDRRFEPGGAEYSPTLWALVRHERKKNIFGS